MRNGKKFLAGAYGIMALLPGSSIGAQDKNIFDEKRNVTEELRRSVNMTLAIARQGNETKLKEVTDTFVIPDAESWFVATFGEEKGAQMASAYEVNLRQEKNTLLSSFEKFARQPGELQIQNADTLASDIASPCAQALLRSAKQGLSFYRLSLQWNDGPNIRQFVILGYFTLVNGSYRYLDCQVLGLRSDSQGASGLLYAHPILKVEGKVQATKILKSVQPVYPEEARKAGISGRVLLHVLISKDGTVQQMAVISGPSALRQSALDSVKQWTYKPTHRSAKPVEIDTVVEVNFTASK